MSGRAPIRPGPAKMSALDQTSPDLGRMSGLALMQPGPAKMSVLDRTSPDLGRMSGPALIQPGPAKMSALDRTSLDLGRMWDRALIRPGPAKMSALDRTSPDLGRMSGLDLIQPGPGKMSALDLQHLAQEKPAAPRVPPWREVLQFKSARDGTNPRRTLGLDAHSTRDSLTTLRPIIRSHRGADRAWMRECPYWCTVPSTLSPARRD